MSFFSSSNLFNFEVNEEQLYFKDITENIRLNIEKETETIAVLYFTQLSDEMDNEIITNIDIPEGIKVYTYDEKKEKIVENPMKNSQQYILCWTENYIIEYNDNCLCKIISKKSWDILS
jgi:hypothetical protein